MLEALLLAFLLFSFGTGENVETNHCCMTGSARARERLDCIWQNETATNDEDELCVQTTLLCCRQEYRFLECRLGADFAKTNRHCKIENISAVYSSPTETCCTTCLAAQLTQKLLKRCVYPGTVDPLINHIFDKCCEETNYPTSQEPVTAKTQLSSLCDQFPGQLCAQVCVPTHSSYYCKCHDGFILMEDQKTCQPDNPKPRESKPRQIIPNPEKPVPLVKPSNKTSCENYTLCKAEEQCTETSKGAICVCRAGFKRGITFCEDINECLENDFLCNTQFETCENEIGSYRCLPKNVTNEPNTCASGFKFVNNRCEDLDECNQPNVCGFSEICQNSIGSYNCRCATGYHREDNKGPCVDINECQINNHNCLPEQRCDNTVGSFICHRLAGCGTGYTLNYNTNECEDDDECLLNTHNCDMQGPSYQCRNTQGSFRCDRKKCYPGDANCEPSRICSKGYELHPESNHCIDINECQRQLDNCNRNTHYCNNKRGSFECESRSCHKGFESTIHGCLDVDECLTGQHNCSANSQCMNTQGGFSCNCRRGFHKRTNTECEDINECQLRSCPGSADCVNTQGSYRCVCKAGFTQLSGFVCQDQDECAIPGTCDQVCFNIPGSYQCYCNSGYTLDSDNRTCIDIDECAGVAKDLCRGICVNTQGGFHCSCPPGYIERDNICNDINECNFANNTCKGDGKFCVNTRGGSECVNVDCPPDYFRRPDMPNMCVFNGCNGSVAACSANNYFSITQTFVALASNMTVGRECRHIVAFRGNNKQGQITRFELNLRNVNHPPQVEAATMEHFYYQESIPNTVRICLARTLQGPQQVDVDLIAITYVRGYHASKALIKVAIFVSQYFV